jgi:hypothetical protein
MFFSKKKEEPKNDKLEELKKQLAELREKELELDKKSAEKLKSSQQDVSVAQSPSVEVQSVVLNNQQDKQEKNIQLNREPEFHVSSGNEIEKSIKLDQFISKKDILVNTDVVRDREIEKFVGNVNGVVLEIGAGMSINVPIKPRMSIDEFIKISERVKALSALNFENKY